MIRQDFIMALLEELGRKIAELKKKKAEHDPAAADKAKQECYGMLKMNPGFIRTHTAEDIIAALNDTALIEQLVVLLLEDEECRRDRNCLQKARILLEYVGQNDRTFSFDRMRMASDLEELLS